MAVLSPHDLEDLTPEQSAAWKGYAYNVVADSFTADDGDKGSEIVQTGEHFVSLEQLLAHVRANGKRTWKAWLDRREGMVTAKDKTAKDGSYKQFALIIRRLDGQPLDGEETLYIGKSLRLKV